MLKTDLYKLVIKSIIEIGFELIDDKKYYQLGKYKIIIIGDKLGPGIGIEVINTEKNDNSYFDPNDFIKFTTYIFHNDSDETIIQRLNVTINDIKKYPKYIIYLRRNKIKKLKNELTKQNTNRYENIYDK